MKKNVIGMVFTILVLVFVIIGLIGSWYTSHMKISSGTMDMESDSNIYLTRMDGKSVMAGQTSEQSVELSDIREQYEAAGMDTSFIDAIGNVFIITIIALIFTIIALVFAVTSIFKPKLQMIGGIFAIIVFILVLLAPILFMTGFSSYLEAQTELYGTTAGEANMGFWYSVSEGGSETSMGPGYAWYLMIIGAIFALIAGIMLFIKQKQALPTPHAVPMQPQTPPVNPPTQ